jgi:DNA repair protein RecN (Recombination protein N)
MIRHLYIKNFVLIDEVSLDFEEGFSAFTGETGAGKSILIDAISLLCAGRANTSYVMKGKDRAIVEGTFAFSSDSHALAVLHDAGFDCEEEVTLTRELTAAGKSTARIDHRIVTLGLLKDVLANEIDIHGQRDNQYLLNPRSHQHLLDEYLNDGEALKNVQNLYDVYHNLVKEKEDALADTFNENDLEYFQYEIREIEDADLKPGEDEELEAKEKQYNAVKDSYDKFNTILTLYNERTSDDLYEILKTMNSLKSADEIDAIRDAYSDAYYNLTDAMESLTKLQENMDLSEEDINAMEERLYTIQKLKRKYGRTIEDILAKKEELQKKVDIFADRQTYLDEMDRRISKSLQAYTEAAEKLTAIRQKGAEKLDQEIVSHLKELMLPNARFKVSLTPSEPSRNGSDNVEFLISMNKGQDLKPLQKTASGGELSRLMLGLKVIFTRLQGISTVIFDEIDTGVSGAVANAIGLEMKRLGRTSQVFSVTHLAPVAACAERQYLVAKKTEGETTHTMIHELNEDERIDQLALTASGQISDASRQAARELLERNQKAW